MPPETRYARNGDVSIAYETFGDVVSGVPLLLITGLDFQMVWWPDAFCEQLAVRGFGVARFDNRDAGLSTHFSSARRQSPWGALMGMSKPAYTTLDMLDDALAVMDALAWPSANAMGGSMGAGLAQALALIHPARVRALISCMGIPANAGPLRSLTYIKFPVFLKLRKLGTPSDREGQIELLVSVFRAIASPGFPFPEDWARATAAISHDRSPRDPTSTQRQLAAGRAQKLPPLSQITAPTLVISGRDDPLIKTKGGRDTARKIPGALFISYSGMGHNLPEELWPDLIEKISSIAGLKSQNPPGPAGSRQPA